MIKKQFVREFDSWEVLLNNSRVGLFHTIAEAEACVIGLKVIVDNVD